MTHGTYRSPSNSTNKFIDLIFFLVFFLLKIEISVINFPVIHVSFKTSEHITPRLPHTLPRGTIWIKFELDLANGRRNMIETAT